MGAAKPGPDAGQHPNLVLAHPYPGRSQICLSTMDWPSHLSSQLTLVAVSPDLSCFLSQGLLDGVRLVRSPISDTPVVLVKSV